MKYMCPLPIFGCQTGLQVLRMVPSAKCQSSQQHGQKSSEKEFDVVLMVVPSAPAHISCCAKAELPAKRPSSTMATPKVFISDTLPARVLYSVIEQVSMVQLSVYTRYVALRVTKMSIAKSTILRGVNSSLQRTLLVNQRTLNG